MTIPEAARCSSATPRRIAIRTRFGPDAEHLDVLREPRSILTFSHGNHHCLGAAAARMQARVALTELLARYPRLRRGSGGYPLGIGQLRASARLRPLPPGTPRMTATSLNWQAQRIDAAAPRIPTPPRRCRHARRRRRDHARPGCRRRMLARDALPLLPEPRNSQAAFVDRSADRLAHEVAAADRGRRRRRSSRSRRSLSHSVWCAAIPHSPIGSGPTGSPPPPSSPSYRRRSSRSHAASSPVCVVLGPLERRAGSDAERARWLVRVMLSLLYDPGNRSR